MAKYRVEYDKAGCIGAGMCEVAYSERWTVKEGKAELKGAKGNDLRTLEIQEDELEKMKKAAEACPVNVIHIYDEKGEKIA